MPESRPADRQTARPGTRSVTVAAVVGFVLGAIVVAVLPWDASPLTTLLVAIFPMSTVRSARNHNRKIATGELLTP